MSDTSRLIPAGLGCPIKQFTLHGIAGYAAE